MRPTHGFEPPKANRAGAIRLIIGILLLVIAVDAFTRGQVLVGLARIGFGLLAGLLAWGTLPGKSIPSRWALGLLGVSLVLWIASWVFEA